MTWYSHYPETRYQKPRQPRDWLAIVSRVWDGACGVMLFVVLLLIVRGMGG